MAGGKQRVYDHVSVGGGKQCIYDHVSVGGGKQCIYDHVSVGSGKQQSSTVAVNSVAFEMTRLCNTAVGEILQIRRGEMFFPSV